MREAKTLTAAEIAAFRGRRSVFTAEEGNRMFAIIEQQREQIEKLRGPLITLIYRYQCEHPGETPILYPSAVTDGLEALASAPEKPADATAERKGGER